MKIGECSEFFDFDQPAFKREQMPWQEFYERGWISLVQYEYIKMCEAAGMFVRMVQDPRQIIPAHPREFRELRSNIIVNVNLNDNVPIPKEFRDKKIKYVRLSDVFFATEKIVADHKLPGCSKLTVPIKEFEMEDGSVYELTLTAKFKHKK